MRTFHRILPPLLALFLGGCLGSQDDLTEVVQDGELRVVTRNTATTYYEGPDGEPIGLEYELAKGLADRLGVELKIIVAGTVSEVLEKLHSGEAHFAAAGLTVTESRKQTVRFTRPYEHITQQLVYRVGSESGRPKDVDDLHGILEVIAESSHADRLRQLQQEHPQLSWSENEQLESEELLTMVWEQLIDYTVADSHELTMSQRFYPELRAAFDLTEAEPLAWAFPKGKDDSLFNAAQAYLKELEESGNLAQLIERYYGHLDGFDYVGTRTFMRHIQQRLPEFQQLFEYAAEENDIDWRLLAAMAYQESHWDPQAVSPTGVRGIMMLTQDTARYLGVKKRTDPVQSIWGGALYLNKLLTKFPERIAEPDRRWLAVAAYNVGHGHVEDARIIAQKRGGNPDAWKDVKENLPLLRQRKWYKTTKHGYARGNEATQYVENIRTYYDILVWYSEQERLEEAESAAALEFDSPAL